MANQIRYQVGFDIQQNGLNQLKASLQQLNKLKVSDIMKVNDSDAKSANDALINIRKEAARVEDALKAAFNAKLNTVNIETFNKELNRTGGSIKEVYQTFKQAGTAGQNAFRSLSSYALNTNIQLKETHNLLDKMATTLTNTLKWNIASAAVNGMSRSIEQAFGYVKALDTSLNDIRIVTNKTADDMGKFAEKANDVAQSLGKTTVDYTNAALIYAQQGLSDKEIEERAAITLKTANVTGQSTDAVSEELTAVWNGYKVNAQEAELYVDRLAAVAATTASDLEELSTGMSKVASAAATMGVGQDQLAAQLSTIISVTREAPETIGTSLKTIYARISDIKAGIAEDGATLGYYSGKMAEFGVNVLDANGNLRDMGEVMEEIGGKWGTLTREQQIYLTQTMAGQRQYSRLLALFDNWGEYEKALNTAQNAAGTLQEQQDIYMESTAAHLQTLKASVENIYDSFADTDTINGLIDGISSVANIAAKFIDTIGGGKTALEALGAVGLTVFSSHIAKGVNTTITNFEIARNNAKQFSETLQVLKEWQGIPELDSVAKELFEDREQLLELSKLMSVEQFEGMQKTLVDITQLGNKIASLKDEQTILKQTIEGVLTLEDSWKTADDVMASDKGQTEVLKRLKQQELNIQNVVKAIKQYAKLQRTLNTKMIKGEEISLELEQARTKLEKYHDALKDLAASGQLSERHVESLKRINPVIEKIKNDLSTMDDSIDETAMAMKIQQVIKELEGIAVASEGTARKAREAVETEMGGALDSVSGKVIELQEEFQIAGKKFQEGIDKTQRAVSFENFSKTVGAITSLAMGIQQIQGLGGIWSEEDVSMGEKLLETITVLGFAAPMLGTALSSLNKVFHFVTFAELENVAAMELFNAAMEKGAVQTSAFGKAFAASPLFLWLAGLSAVIVGIGIYGKHLEKVKQQRIENAKAEIEEANAKQEEIETNKQLYSSIEELNQKYKSGEITRQQLKSSVQSLIQQYGLEGEAAKKLTRDYDNLGASIKQARKTASEQALKSAQEEKDNTETVLSNTSRGRLYTSLDKSTFSSSLSDVIGEYAGETGIGSFYLEGEGNSQIEKTIDLYDKLSQAVQKADKDSKNSSQTYQEVSQWLRENKQAVQAYKNALEDTQKYIGENTLSNLEYNGQTDFSNIDSFTEYAAQKQVLINEINQTLKEQGNTTADAVELADKTLKNNFEDLYSQYGEMVNYIDSLKEKLGTPPKNLNEMLEKLDGKQLSALMKIDASAVNSWNDVYTAAAQIASIDFSNINAVRNIEGAQQSAADNYTFYQGLEDQVRDGKKISKSEIGNLSFQLQSFFTMMADGSYKLTGNAEEFYATVNNLKLDGFYKAIGQVNDELSKVGRVQALGENFDYNSINQKALEQVDLGMLSVKKVDYDLAGQQLEYLKAVTDSNDELNISIGLWEKQIKDQQLSKDAVKAIAEAVASAGDQTQGLDEKTADLQEKAKALKEQLHDAIFPIDKDIDESALNALAKNLQQLAPNLDDLSNELTQDADAARDVAEAFLRFDNAIEDIVGHYEEWSQILNNGSEIEKVSAVEELRDAYGDLLNIDGSVLSKDFLLNAENLQLMKAVIDGDIDAYNQLIDLANQDIIAHMQLSPQDQVAFEEALNHIRELLNDPNIQSLQVGAHIRDEQFLKTLDNMIRAAGDDTSRIQSLLQNMGVQANLIPVEEEWDDWQEFPQARATWTLEPVQVDLPANGSIKDVMGSVVSTIKNARLQTDAWTTSIPAHKKVKAYGIDYSSVTKAASGGTKYRQSSNGAGSKGQARRTAAANSSTPKSSSSKSSGGSTSNNINTSTKDFKDPLEDGRDIYHDINVEIKQVERNLDRVQKAQERLYGKDLLNNLNKQTEILEKHKQKLREKQSLQQQDLANQQSILRSLGVTFDQYGNIANYMNILAEKQAAVNELVAQYNSLISSFNASTDKDFKENLSQQIDVLNKQIQNAEEDLKNTKDKINSYDSLREAMEDITDQIEEETQRQIEINIQKFRMELEIRLDMSEAQRDWNKFQREVINHTDIIKDTDFSRIFKDAKTDVQDIISYFDVAGNKSSIQKLTEQLWDTRAEIESIDKIGSSEIYGDNKAQAMEDLTNDLHELEQQLEDINSLIDDIDQAYLDTIDDIGTNFNKRIDDYEYITDLLEHDIDLLNLLYGDKNYEAMDKYYTSLQRNQNNQIDALRKQANYWKAQWDYAVRNGETQTAKIFEENYRNALSNLNQIIENAAQTLRNKYENSIESIFDTLDRKISDGMGTDYLSMEWDLMQMNAEEYLDTINSAFAIQGIENKFQKALRDTNSNNIKAQQSIKKLMDQQLSSLKTKDKLTQYDVDRAEKLLQIEQARIALEEARSSKTSMRLKRDSQGNYSYEYAADEDNILDAENALATAQNDLYNFDKDAYKSNLESMLAAWREFRDKYKEIVLDVSLSDEERIAKLSLLEQEYGEFINDKTAQNQVIRTNLMDSAFRDIAAIYDTDVSNYMNMAEDEKNILMGDLVPMWTSGIQMMSDEVAGAGGFIPTCEEAFIDIINTTKEYQADLDELANTAGIDLQDVESGVDSLSVAFEELIGNNDELIDRMSTEMDSIRNLRAQWQGMKDDANEFYNAAIRAVQANQQFLQAQQAKAAAEASKYNGGGTGRVSTGYTNTNNYNDDLWRRTNHNPNVASGGKDGIISVGDVATFSGQYFYDSWGTKPAGKRLAGITDAVQVDILNNNEYGVHIKGAGVYSNWTDLGWIKRSQLYGYDTGGYTGSWGGNDGRLALLHQKELVLNKDDTSNLLNAVDILRSVTNAFHGSMIAKLGELKAGFSNMVSQRTEEIGQNVHIEASFPNVDSKREIEEALNDLVNLAAQRAMRRG